MKPMLRWFEQTDHVRPGIISSRIRLVRNWQEYQFPAKLDEKESMEMVHRLEFGLKDLGNQEGKHFEFSMLSEL
jgi:protein arginine kinase